MIVSQYDHGYHDEFGNTHVVIKRDNGWTTYSYSLLIKYHKIRNNKTPSEKIEDHPFVGLSFTNREGKKVVVKEVWKHYGFGTYFNIIYEDENLSGGIFTLSSEGFGIEQESMVDNSTGYEKQLLDQIQ